MSGKCPVCGFSASLRKDGKIGAHKLYGGFAPPEGSPCAGAGQDPVAQPHADCPRCHGTLLDGVGSPCQYDEAA